MAESDRSAPAADGAPDGPAPARPARGPLVVGVTVALLVLTAAVVWALVAGRGGDAAPVATPEPSPAVTEPTTQPTEEPSAEPTEEEPEGPQATADPSEPPAAGDDAPLLPELEPVPLDDEVDVEVEQGALVIALARLEAVEGTARDPGEVGGPALRVTVSVANDTDAEVDLTGVVVNVTYGDDRTPAVELGGPGVERLPASVAAGGAASGTYVFTVPTDERELVQVSVDYAAGRPIVVFEGAAPRG